MKQTSTITSKRQLTIPARIFRELGLRPGGQVRISRTDKKIVIEPMAEIVESLAGSITLPKRFARAKDMDKIIKDAKQEYFAKKNDVC